MSAIPVGYDSIQGIRRKGVSLLCIFLASAMAMGIFVYIDSYSVHQWHDTVDGVGSVAMSVYGDSTAAYLNDIQNIPEVLKAARIQYSYASFSAPLTVNQQFWGQTVWFTEDYTESFPDTYELLVGSYPTNESQITISEDAADYLGLHVGEQVNYTMYWDSTWVLLDIVGIFQSNVETTGGYYASEVAVIVPDLMEPYDRQNVVISVEIDRSPLNPFNAAGSLSYVLSIVESIKALDPHYGPPYYDSNLWVANYIGGAIQNYMTWQMNIRITQIVRGAGTLLLVVLTMLLAIRHNMNDRRYENNMLMSRGASQGDIEKRVLKEILGLSALGTVLGLGVGILFSRAGLAATGFFEFDPVLFFTEPFLVSVESLILTVLIGMILPIISWFGYNAFYSTKRRIDESTGKLEKASKILGIIRWDVILFLLSAFMLLGLLSTGALLQYNPLLQTIASFVPLAMFVSMGSLIIKALRRGANIISRGMNSVVGILPSSIGIRRLGKSASSAGPAVLVLVLSISVAWTYSVVGASMPYTKQNQARFAFGGDVAFHVGYYPSPEISNFTLNVTNHKSTAASSMIYKTDVLLSTDMESDRAKLIGMNPDEYQMVGYDQWGNQLNSSDLKPLMDTLALTSAGVILTNDLASMYDLEVGDTVRTFADNYYENDNIYVFTVVGIVNALSNSDVLDTGTPQPGDFYPGYYPDIIGGRTMWVNKDYLGTLLSLSNDTQNILCVRTVQGANGTAYVEDLLENGGNQLIYEDNWACTTYEVESYINSVSYRIDRAVDTLLAIASSAVIFAAFIIYAFEGLNERKREIALIRSMGGEEGLIVKAQFAEMIILIFSAVVLLGAYGPLHIMNALIGITSSYYTFPISVFPIFPLQTMMVVFLFFIVSAIIFVLVVAKLSAHVNIAEALNASWAESGPYGGDV